MIENLYSYGYLFERENDKIISVTYYGLKIKLNQVVVSNGRVLHKSDTRGVVKKIHLPFTGGHTSDFLEVLFEGNKITSFMKFKDLKL